jgi:hypothetical protein
MEERAQVHQVEETNMAPEGKDGRSVLNDLTERQAAGVEEAHRAISDLKHGRTAMAASRI